jgi:hypothetical protein
MVSAILIAYLLGAREEKRVGLPKDSLLDMVLVAGQRHRGRAAVIRADELASPG